MTTQVNEDFTGKVAFVTGGGDGIGRAIALRFAQGGASVVVAGRTDAKIKKTVQLIESAGGKALAVVCDVRKENEVKVALDKTNKNAFFREYTWSNVDDLGTI